MLLRSTAVAGVVGLIAGLLSVGTAGLAANACPRPVSDTPPRIAGTERTATAAQVALAGHDGSDVDTVVVVGSHTYADATVGAVLAAAIDAPLLMTDRRRLSPPAADALARFDPDRDGGEVIVLGGGAAVASGVDDQLRDHGWVVHRVYGPDRYATAEQAAAAAAARTDGAASEGPLIVVSGTTWSDAAAGAAHAAGRHGQLAFTRPDDASALRDRADQRSVTVIGGADAVSDRAYRQLAEVASDIRRIAGGSQTGTVARVAATQPGAPAMLATTAGWPDAIVAAVAAARDRGVVLLTEGEVLDRHASGELAGRAVTVVGGTAAVAAHVAADAADASAADVGAPVPTATPPGCTVTTAHTGTSVRFAVATDRGELRDVAVTVSGPASHTVEADGGRLTITVVPSEAGSIGVALSGTAVDADAERAVNVGWRIAASDPPPTSHRSREGWLVAGGDGPLVGSGGPTVTYSVEIADGLEQRQDLTAFAGFVQGRLSEPERGWTARGGYRLQRIDDPDAADIRVLLASPSTVDRLCARAGLRTNGRYSCWNGRVAAINADRWFHGVDHVGDRRLYRTYVINHEVGHGLGHRHRSCPAEGALAPVMMQLTKSTYGCRPNGWPYP